ncbi:MAG TPA: DUF167 domain-containing protein [Gammaproteobacteria bacterium]|nr:DUF167 domain-containing protein [Gammaproteobacteria bacterium]
MPAAPRRFWQVEGEALLLTVKVRPGAKTDALAGIEDGALKVRLKAPAIEGRANEGLQDFLAKCFRTSKTRVEIVRGKTGRLKQVRITGARVAPESLFS